MIEKLGKYKITEKLGEGAMGAVYKAYDEASDRYVAVKAMSSDIKWDPEFKLRFYRAAQSAASLNHPNIVTILELGEEDKITFIVMELLVGQDFKTIIRERSPFTLEQKLSFMAQVGDGLSHAHTSGVIHRDIKPSNIHLSDNGNVKILDFGIARIPSSDLTRSGVRRGTPIYMSPELIRGHQCDERSDIFSAGIVFYELLTYIHPFRGKNIVKTMDNILSQAHLPFAEQFPDAPSGLLPILNNCLEKEPCKRFGSMTEVSRMCRQLLDDLDRCSRNIKGELEAVMPRLRSACEKGQASARVVQLYQEAKALLGREAMPDYLSLQRLMSDLAREPEPHIEIPPAGRGIEEMFPPPPIPDEAAPKKQILRPPCSFAEAPDLQGAMAPAPPQPEPADILAETTLPMTPPSAPSPPAEPQGRNLDEIQEQELIKTCAALLKQNRLQEAADSLRQGMGLVGPRDELVRLMGETRRRIEEQKRSHCAELLGGAREAIGSRNFAAAIQALDEVLQLQPGDSEVSEMHRQARLELEKEKKQNARKAEGEREKALGFKLLAERKFRDSLRVLRHAAELVGADSAIELGIDEAKDGVRQEELHARVQSGLAEATSLFRAQAWEKAREQTIQVLELSPKNAVALELLDRIERNEEQQQLNNRVETLCRQSVEAMVRRDFGEAATLANDVLGIEPANTLAKELLGKIEQEEEEFEKRQEVSALLAKSQQALAQQDFDGATASAESALSILPQDALATALLAQIRQAREERKKEKEIATAVAQARQALLRGELDRSEEHARKALAISPQHEATLEVLARIEEAHQTIRKDQVAARIAQGRRALDAGDFNQARRQAQETLRDDPKCAEAAALLQGVVQAEEKHRRSGIESLLNHSRASLDKRNFDESAELTNQVLALDRNNKEAKSLVKAIERGRRAAEKELKKQKAKEPAKEAPHPVAVAPSDKAMIMPAKPESVGGGRKRMLWIGVAVVVLTAAGGLALQMVKSRAPKPPDLSTQIAAARSSLDQKLYDKAIELSELVLAASPANADAAAILKEARQLKKRSAIETLMLSAQNLRAQRRLDDANGTLIMILDIDPAYKPALEVRSQIEAEIVSTRSMEEQDKTIKEWFDNAVNLLAAGKTNEAKAEIDNVARLRPDAPELEPLRKKWKDQAAADAAREQADREEAQKQSRIATIRQKSSDLFSQGKYADAQAALNEWLGDDPQNSQANSLRNQINDAQTATKNYETAISEKRYEDALNAIAHLQKINPMDPNIEACKKRADDSKASARATLSVMRLGEPGTLALDDQPVGANGEIDNKFVPIGRHKLSVKNAQGRQNMLNVDLIDGQKVEFVYDSSAELRTFAPATDRALLEKRRTREEIHSLQAEHNHGALRGKCKGVLTISGISVTYHTTETDHGFSYRFEELALAVNNDRLEFSAPENKRITFTLPNAANAREVKQLWDKLLQLGKQ